MLIIVLLTNYSEIRLLGLKFLSLFLSIFLKDFLILFIGYNLFKIVFLPKF